MTAPLWVTKQQAAQICASKAQPKGISTSHFDASIRPMLAPEDMVEGRGKGGCKFRAAAVITAWVAHRLANDAKPAESEGDPLLSGDGSPALERYRLAKAIEQEKKNAISDGELLKRNEVEPALLRLAGILAGAGDTYQRLYGLGAEEPINEALDDFQQSVREFLKRDDDEPDPSGDGSNGGENPPSPLAIHAGVRRAGNRRPHGAVSRKAV